MESDDALAVVIAFVSHKWVEALSLGIIMVKEDLPLLWFCILMGFFSTLTPIGIGIGSLAAQYVFFHDSCTSTDLSHSDVLVMGCFGNSDRNLSPIVVNIFSAIATGSFLYIGTTEILAEEFHTHHHKTLARWLKFGALILGCALLSVVRIWAGDDDHDHGGAHNHDH